MIDINDNDILKAMIKGWCTTTTGITPNDMQIQRAVVSVTTGGINCLWWSQAILAVCEIVKADALR